MNKEESMKLIGKRIKRYREMLALSQQELAQKSGYSSRAMICRIENGNVDISRQKLIDIASALQVEVSDIIDTEEPTAYTLTDDEKEFIEAYRKSSSASRLKAYAELIRGSI